MWRCVSSRFETTGIWHCVSSRFELPLFWCQVVQEEDCDPSTCRDLLPERHSFLSQKTKITRNTAERTQISLPSSCLFVDLNWKLLSVVLCTKLQASGWHQKIVRGGVETRFSWCQFEKLLPWFQVLFCSFDMRLYCTTYTLPLVLLS